MQERFKNLGVIQEIFPFLWRKEEKIRSLFLIACGLIFISIGLDLSIPLVLKEVISKLSAHDRSMTFQLSLLLASYGLIWTFSQVTQQIRQIIMVRPLERGIRLFCFSLFDHLHSLPMKFHLDRKTGAITNALERAQHGLPDVFWGLFLFIIPKIIELFLATALLCYFYGYIYGLILIFIATIFIAFTLYSTEWASRLQHLSNEQQSHTNANIVDSLLNFASVKYFNNKNYEMTKCDNLLRKRENCLVKSISGMEFIRIGQSVIIGIGLVILTYTAGKQALLNGYDVSDFVLINGYVLQFAAPLSQMGFIARDVRRGLNEVAGTMEIYRTKPAISWHAEENYKELKEIKNIEFRDVSFGYEPSRLVLKNVSFYLPEGKTIGIVGATGAGKSTISNLLFKFFDTNSGKILINNEDIQNLKTENLHRLLGIVPQDVTLFNTSIFENILFARPNATKEEVEEAIELSHLTDSLKKLSGHYHTIVGERGLKLSGGEKQRIAIARVLLKRPSLYIFDESTSSLDLLTEEIIMKSIESIMKKSTAIIIAHRLSTVINTDEILVLQNGIVEEQGSHSVLLKKQGRYASLWEAQAESYKKHNVA